MGSSAAAVSSAGVSSAAGFSSALALAFAAPSASFTTACFGEYSSVTSSMTAIGALSPLRGPIFVMRV